MMTEGSRPAIQGLAEAHGAEQHQAENGKVGQLAEDDEEEGEGLVGSARPVVDVVVEHDDLGDAKGIAKPHDGKHHEDERAEDALGVGDSLQSMLAGGCLRGLQYVHLRFRSS